MTAPYDGSYQQAEIVSNWAIRLVAAIIDSIPFAIIGWIIEWALFLNAGSPGWLFAAGAGGWLVWLFIYPLFYGVMFLVYSYLMESSASAATFGKKFMGLQVQSVKGGKAESSAVLKRNLSKILWIIFLIDILLGVLTHGPDPRQRYFDRIAGTTVVQTKQSLDVPPPPPPPPPPPT